MKKNQLKLNFQKSQIIAFLTVFILLFSFTGASGQEKLTKNSPVFSKFIYQGNDQVYKDNPLKPDEFYNPILQGCYPDPAITKKGDDYYLVCSSFAMFPGVPIFHSKDLVNWTSLGGVLDNPSNFDTHDCGISAGVYCSRHHLQSSQRYVLYDCNSIHRWTGKHYGKNKRSDERVG